MSQEDKEVKTNDTKCYNSFACISVVCIIVFILGSILYDMLVTKPEIRDSITDIKTELRTINERLEQKTYIMSTDMQEIVFPADSLMYK